MTQTKLFILGLEIELLWTDMHYYREIRMNGKPATEIMGGLINLCFATGENTDQILRWMTKESEDDTWEEVDKMEKGKVCFYENGFDYPPTKTYDFNDAHLIYFKEIFNAEGKEPMQTIITISPAIQNYGTDFVKRWNVSWVAPSERMPYQSKEENNEPNFLSYHLEDIEDNRITKKEIDINEEFFIIIKTEYAIGESISIDLEDKSKDFEYNGKHMKDDIIRNIKITDNITKIKIKAVEQKN